MKHTVFYLATDQGTVDVSTNEFWWQYNHCKKVHPEEEPIRSALEHIFGGPLATDVPPLVKAGCREIINFYSARAKPGNVYRAMEYRRSRYTKAQSDEQLKQARMNYILNNFNGTMQ